MKIFISVLLLTILVTLGSAQDMKISGENIRKTERIVKNAPFSTEAVSESVQILADGNRITRRSISRLYRDSEGRYRREDLPKQLGVPGAVIDMPESILILDPIAGYRYQLNTKRNTARKSEFGAALKFDMDLDLQLKLEGMDKDLKVLARNGVDQAMVAAKRAAMAAQRAAIQEQRAVIQEQRAEIQEERVKQLAEIDRQLAEKGKLAADLKGDIEKRDKPNSQTESLGVQNIEGVDAEGSRTTTTIPAGSIGNEREIQVVYEKWYSKDLQVIVYSKHVDPRFGEQTYRLTNINRTEPPITLFSPPSDYQIVEDGRRPVKPALPAIPKVAPIEPKPPREPHAAITGKKAQ